SAPNTLEFVRDSPVKTPANATLKFDVELLAFGPKAKEM
ncbi:hypothetical protein PF005_g19516, partial [Phytophthora fragariae]